MSLDEIAAQSGKPKGRFKRGPARKPESDKGTADYDPL